MNEMLRLRAGRLTLLFDHSTLFVRKVCWDGQEVVRAIYGAVRDRNWGTVTPVLRSFDLTEQDGAYLIKLSAECKAAEIDYFWCAEIRIRESSLTFDFEGVARSEFLRNRIGLCVLHPIALCAGAPCEVVHSDGQSELSNFPKQIAPFQPFFDIRRIRYSCRGTDVDILCEGDIFEMEDQRNWTDSSFKTYCTPLALPFPRRVFTGDRIKQSVTVRFFPRHTESNPKPSSTVVLRCDFSKPHPRPLLGFGASGEGFCVPLLSSVGPDHIRVDCRPTQENWREVLSRADREAIQSKAGLHIAVFLGSDKERELESVSEAAGSLKSRVKVWLIFDADRLVTRRESIELARGILPPAEFAAGADANFTELNRDRPPRDADWLPCFSFNPQVHAIDDLTLIENIEAQRDVIESARTFATRPIVISPITLHPRSNPAHDARQGSELIAGWTLGTISAISAPEVYSATFFETVGAGGIIDSSGNPTPTFHVFRAVSALKQFVHITRDPEWDCDLSTLAGVDESGRKVLLIANHRAETVEVCAEMDQPFSTLRIGTLGDEQVEETSAGSIHLPAMALKRIEILP